MTSSIFSRVIENTYTGFFDKSELLVCNQEIQDVISTARDIYIYIGTWD